MNFRSQHSGAAASCLLGQVALVEVPDLGDGSLRVRMQASPNDVCTLAAQLSFESLLVSRILQIPSAQRVFVAAAGFCSMYSRCNNDSDAALQVTVLVLRPTHVQNPVRAHEVTRLRV